MPELPEVETVRRGLAPAMEGARFQKVEARRGDLRWPLPKDFVQRLEGQTVAGLGRRAKYLLADLSSGEVLLMHLGMSGSFRVLRDAGEIEQGKRPLGFFLKTAGTAFWGWVDGGDERVLPSPVQPARHQVVHEVVAARHAVENVVDQRLLVVERHLPKSEMGVLAGRRHQNSPFRAGP